MMTRAKGAANSSHYLLRLPTKSAPRKTPSKGWHENLALVAPSLLHVGRATCWSLV